MLKKISSFRSVRAQCDSKELQQVQQEEKGTEKERPENRSFFKKIRKCFVESEETDTTTFVQSVSTPALKLNFSPKEDDPTTHRIREWVIQSSRFTPSTPHLEGTPCDTERSKATTSSFPSKEAESGPKLAKYVLPPTLSSRSACNACDDVLFSRRSHPSIIAAPKTTGHLPRADMECPAAVRPVPDPKEAASGEGGSCSAVGGIGGTDSDRGGTSRGAGVGVNGGQLWASPLGALVAPIVAYTQGRHLP